MICLICKRAFVIDRGIIDLFKKQRYFICNKCYKDYPLEIKYQKIPLDNNYDLNIISLLPDCFKGYYLAYINEYSYIVERYLDRPILLYDSFYLSKDNIKNAQAISGIEKSDIYIICFKFIIK